MWSISGKKDMLSKWVKRCPMFLMFINRQCSYFGRMVYNCVFVCPRKPPKKSICRILIPQSPWITSVVGTHGQHFKSTCYSLCLERLLLLLARTLEVVRYGSGASYASRVELSTRGKWPRSQRGVVVASQSSECVSWCRGQLEIWSESRIVSGSIFAITRS